jgi:hypothetical protein
MEGEETMKIIFNKSIPHEPRLRVMRAIGKFLEALADQNVSIQDFELRFDGDCKHDRK